MTLQKTKDTILKDLDDLLTNPLKNMGIVTLPGDSKRMIADFLLNSIDEVARAGYREGVEDALECMPDCILDNGHKRTEQEPTEDEKTFDEGYNLCRSGILTALNELIDKS